MGRLSQRQAEAVKIRVEHLVAAQVSGHPADEETARWVASLDQGLHDKLTAAGLVRQRESTTLGLFLDNISRRGPTPNPQL